MGWNGNKGNNGYDKKKISLYDMIITAIVLHLSFVTVTTTVRLT